MKLKQLSISLALLGGLISFSPIHADVVDADSSDAVVSADQEDFDINEAYDGSALNDSSEMDSVVAPRQITCFARSRFGGSFYARGVNPANVERRAVRKCEVATRMRCRPMGCRY